MRRYLVVANQTLSGEHLVARIRDCLRAGPSSFFIVVPAAPPADHVWTEGEARTTAQGHLDKALERFRALGAEVDGEVGDGNPLLAIEDASGKRNSTRLSSRRYRRGRLNGSSWISRTE